MIDVDNALTNAQNSRMLLAVKVSIIKATEDAMSIPKASQEVTRSTNMFAGLDQEEEEEEAENIELALESQKPEKTWLERSESKKVHMSALNMLSPRETTGTMLHLELVDMDSNGPTELKSAGI
jgi:hypothetical protein